MLIALGSLHADWMHLVDVAVRHERALSDRYFCSDSNASGPDFCFVT